MLIRSHQKGFSYCSYNKNTIKITSFSCTKGTYPMQLSMHPFFMLFDMCLVSSICSIIFNRRLKFCYFIPCKHQWALLCQYHVGRFPS